MRRGLIHRILQYTTRSNVQGPIVQATTIGHLAKFACTGGGDRTGQDRSGRTPGLRCYVLCMPLEPIVPGQYQ